MQLISTFIFISSFIFYRPDPNILLFRRPLGTDGRTGRVNPEEARIQKQRFRREYGLE